MSTAHRKDPSSIRLAGAVAVYDATPPHIIFVNQMVVLNEGIWSRKFENLKVLMKLLLIDTLNKPTAVLRNHSGL